LEAQHANDAIALVRRPETQIDMLISDVVMPDMSGIDLAAELRATQPDLRVLLMSGYSGLAMTRHGELQSDIPFLEKPFNPDTVARKVSEVLEHASSLPPLKGR
ncbi:MAG TPA: response regulator, partial [Polyangiales bacterium]|nr:response regulator [Polyangiales bacterium]